MHKKAITSSLLFALLLSFAQPSQAQSDYYFPKAKVLDTKIPTPEQFLGYPVGSFFTRHDAVVAYFKELARVSDRIHVTTIGRTYENREQIVVTATSPDNYGRLEQIRQEHLTQTDLSKPALESASPVVIYLAYGVHGNETSSTEASLLAGYYLAASQDEEAVNWLKQTVIFIEPTQNPDGRDRAANWVNAYHTDPPVGDASDKEHVEQWPAGRTNHYFTDLNRDWLNLVQVESRNRVAFFHKWYPNVQIDFHEQGTNATYYFEPTPSRHYSPIIPKFLYDEGIALAKYNAQALDEIGSLYFTKEGYDNLSPIYGSTYPKFYGAVAATYEQASSRGVQQESSNGLLTFRFTIRNHLTTSFSTIRAAVAEKVNLFKTQKNFFKYALDEGQKSTAKAFVFGNRRDANLTQKFLGLLLQHHINVYELDNNLAADGQTFEKGTSYIVPAAQPNYLIVHSLFEDNILTDSVYYDNTGWNVIQAYGLKYGRVTADFSKGKQVETLPDIKGTVEGGKSLYAYVTGVTNYNTTKVLYHLLDKKVLVKVAYKPFAVNAASGKQSYSYGSLVIPVAGQSISPDSLYKLLQDEAADAHINFTGVTTGYSVEGIDLGSNNIRAVKKPEIAIAFGQGVNSSEAGETWFLLSKQLDIPVTKLDLANFQRANLNRYTTIVLPGGSYAAWDAATVEKVRNWVSNGGNLVTFQSASAWAIEKGIAKEKVVAAAFGGRDGNQAAQPQTTPVPTGNARNANQEPGTNTPANESQNATPNEAAAANRQRQTAPGQQQPAADSTAREQRGAGRRNSNSEAGRLDFARQEDMEGARRINGAIFVADLDTTNPIAFGVTSRKLYINKNGSTILQPSSNKYATAAQYLNKPFIDGYAPRESIPAVANSAAIITTNSGSGSIVLFADDPVYRGYWLGTARLFINAVFFAGGGGRGGGGAEE